MINWKVRFMNKAWVVTFIAALFILITAVGHLFGFELDLSNIQDNVINVVYAIFGVMAVLGVVSDPTTETLLQDGPLGLQYTKPGGFIEEDEAEEEEAEE